MLQLRPNLLHGEPQLDVRVIGFFHFAAQRFQPEPAGFQVFRVRQQQFLLPAQFGLLLAAFVVPRLPFGEMLLPLLLDRGRNRRFQPRLQLVFPFQRPIQFLQRGPMPVELRFATPQLPLTVFQALPGDLPLISGGLLIAFQFDARLFQVVLLEADPVFDYARSFRNSAFSCSNFRRCSSHSADSDTQSWSRSCWSCCSSWAC